jgi:hypothetical protein
MGGDRLPLIPKEGGRARDEEEEEDMDMQFERGRAIKNK